MLDRLYQWRHRTERRVRRLDLRNLAARTGWVTSLDRFRYATGIAFALLTVGVVTALSNTARPLSFLLSPPAFRRLRSLDSDLAIVHRG